MTTKTVDIKPGDAADDSYRYDDLQLVIDAAHNCGRHIHEGPADPATGYPSYYDVCDCEE